MKSRNTITSFIFPQIWLHENLRIASINVNDHICSLVACWLVSTPLGIIYFKYVSNYWMDYDDNLHRHSWLTEILLCRTLILLYVSCSATVRSTFVVLSEIS